MAVGGTSIIFGNGPEKGKHPQSVSILDPPLHHPPPHTDEGPLDWIIKSLVTFVVSQFNRRIDQI